MSPNLQVKLLRALQEREFQRLGDTKVITVDVRIIAATNADLAQLVDEGTFREDLYYRLNVIPLQLPPLRDRREDIPLLVQTFLEQIGEAQTPARSNVAISQAAMRRLMAFEWPGNIRQLENVIERALTLTPGQSQVDVGDLPPEIQKHNLNPVRPDVALPEHGLDLSDHLSTIERELIRLALEQTQGNKQKAASLLNIKRTTLVEKTKRLSINPQD